MLTNWVFSLWRLFLNALISIHSSNGDACLHKLPLVPRPPAPVLDQVPGVGVAAAGHGHPPDWRLLRPLPELWHGRPSALQSELPGLCARCRQRRAHPLPQHHGAQVGRYVRWRVGASEGGLWVGEREAELSGLDWAELRWGWCWLWRDTCCCLSAYRELRNQLGNCWENFLINQAEGWSKSIRAARFTFSTGDSKADRRRMHGQESEAVWFAYLWNIRPLMTFQSKNNSITRPSTRGSRLLPV